MNVQGNCRKNSSGSGSAPPTNPATLLPPFANLLSKGRIKYGVTGLVRVSINSKLLVLHVTHLHSVDGATVRQTGPSNLVHLNLMPSSPNWAVRRTGPSIVDQPKGTLVLVSRAWNVAHGS